MDMKEEAVPVLEMVAASLSSESWMSTQTTAYSLIAVSRFTGGKSVAGKLTFEYKFNGGEWRKAETSLPTAQIQLPVGTELSGALEVRNRGEKMVFARMVQSGTPPPGMENAENSNLDVSVEYRDMDDRLLDISQLTQGTDFKAVYTVRNPGRLGTYRTLALTTIFPSGWEIHNERLFTTLNTIEPFDYRDFRDDRIMTYFMLSANQGVKFTIRLNAAYSGKFYLPSIKAEEMYRKDIRVLVPGKWVEVLSKE